MCKKNFQLGRKQQKLPNERQPGVSQLWEMCYTKIGGKSMNQKSLQTLEYTKIINQLADFAVSPPGKLLCQNLHPSSDYEEIIQAQTETSDAVSRVMLKGLALWT